MGKRLFIILVGLGIFYLFFYFISLCQKFIFDWWGPPTIILLLFSAFFSIVTMFFILFE